MYSKWSTVQNKLTSGRKINDKICLTNTVNPNRIDPSSQVNTENLKLLYSVHCTVHCTPETETKTKGRNSFPESHYLLTVIFSFIRNKSLSST